MTNTHKPERGLFFVLKARAGRYRACVDFNDRRYSRDSPTREGANEMLNDLRRRLCATPGPDEPVLDAWVREG